MFSFWRNATTVEKVMYVSGATTVVTGLAAIPAGIFGYGAYMGLPCLLSAWTGVRALHHKKESRKQELQSQIQALKQQPPTGASQGQGTTDASHLYTVGRGLAMIRGYSGLVASFSAALFPPSTAAKSVEVAGTLAITSIYVENGIESARLTKEIRFKQQTYSRLKEEQGGEDAEEIDDLTSTCPKTMKGASALAVVSGVGTTVLAVEGEKVGLPPELLSTSVILTSLSVLFTNRFHNNALRHNLATYTKANKALTQKRDLSSVVKERVETQEDRVVDASTPLLPLDVYQQKIKRASTFFQVSATTRGVIGTTLVVETFFKVLTPAASHGLGWTILSLNFLETLLENYILDLECALLSQEYSALKPSGVNT